MSGPGAKLSPDPLRLTKRWNWPQAVDIGFKAKKIAANPGMRGKKKPVSD
jgi:hypothetical protein